jgi:polycystin 2
MYFVLCCEMLFVLFIIYYTIEEALEVNFRFIFLDNLFRFISKIVNMKLAYFKSVMNCLDLIVIIFSYICMAFNVYRQVQVNKLLDKLLTKEGRQYNDFTFLCYWQYQFNIMISATIFLYEYSKDHIYSFISF